MTDHHHISTKGTRVSKPLRPRRTFVVLIAPALVALLALGTSVIDGFETSQGA